MKIAELDRGDARVEACEAVLVSLAESEAVTSERLESLGRYVGLLGNRYERERGKLEI